MQKTRLCSHAYAAVRNFLHVHTPYATAAHGYATFSDRRRDRKKQKFLQKRLSGRHVSVSRLRHPEQEGDAEQQILHVLDLLATGNSPAAVSAGIRSCTKHGLHTLGMLLHHYVVWDGFDGILVLQNLLVQMYNECSLLNDAVCLFSLIRPRDEHLWNFMIRSCSQNAGVSESTCIFNQMLGEASLPNKFCYTSLLLAYCSREDSADGKRMLARLIDIGFEPDALFHNALLGMCLKCADLDDARQLFDRLSEWDLVSWNSMIAAHGKCGRGEKALYYFKQMQQSGILPTESTFVSVLDACTVDTVSFEGRHLHSTLAGTDLERDSVLGSALVNLYGKQGDLAEACRVFDCIVEQSAVSWNVIITAHIINARLKEAQALFHEMLQQGVMIDKFVFVSMFSAYSVKEDLANGKRLYSLLFGMDFEPDAAVVTAILNMFCKCGSMKDAEDVFDIRLYPDAVTWTSMIAGYSQHGQGGKAIQLFKRMQHEGPIPTEVTYTSVLSACSREGLVDEGVQYLLSMSRNHNIKPCIDHYNCIVDLLARSGRLDEAEDIIASISSEEDHVSCTILLNACRTHSDLERGYRAVDRVLDLDLISGSSLVLLSNLSSTC